MKLMEILNEIKNIGTVKSYHGSRTYLPFEEFDMSMDGTGLVSRGNKYGGFFFTTNKENAESYTEWFIAHVKILNVKLNPTDETHSPTVLKRAINDDKIYLITDILDGQYYSDVIVVPANQLNNIQILKWEFVGVKESLFEQYDELFGADDEDGLYINQDMINDTLGMFDADLNYLLKIPIFEEYYNSK